MHNPSSNQVQQSDLPPSQMGSAVAIRRGANSLPPGDCQTRRENILTAERDRREYMKDAPAGRAEGSIQKTPRRFDQSAYVNAIDGRGEIKTTGKKRFNRGWNQHQSRHLGGGAKSTTIFRRTKGASIRLKGGTSKGYTAKKGGSQQHQHSYQKGVLEIAYLRCSASHG